MSNEILFASMEERVTQLYEYQEKLSAVLDDIAQNATLINLDGRIDLVIDVVGDWMANIVLKPISITINAEKALDEIDGGHGNDSNT